MARYRIDYVYHHPESAPASAKHNLGALNTADPALAALSFAAWESLRLAGDNGPIALGFQMYVDTTSPQAAFTDSRIPTAISTALTQMGMATAPAWDTWNVTTLTA